jgi:hypothetical protein
MVKHQGLFYIHALTQSLVVAGRRVVSRLGVVSFMAVAFSRMGSLRVVRLMAVARGGVGLRVGLSVLGGGMHGVVGLRVGRVSQGGWGNG